MTSPFLSIIIPAYNEENRLPQSLEKIFAFLTTQDYASEVLVIENGSSDATYQVAQKFSESHPSLRAIHEDRRGKGYATQRGMLAARGEYRFICDADLSMPIEEIKKFLPPALNDFDVAIGSREAPGAVRYDEPTYRHLGGRAINIFIRMFILPGLNDTQCGFKCFRAASAETLFRLQTIGGFSFDIEILYLARRHRMDLREIPVHWHFNAESKVSAARDALRMLSDIFRIHINALRGVYDAKPNP